MRARCDFYVIFSPLLLIFLFQPRYSAELYALSSGSLYLSLSLRALRFEVALRGNARNIFSDISQLHSTPPMFSGFPVSLPARVFSGTCPECRAPISATRTSLLYRALPVFVFVHLFTRIRFFRFARFSLFLSLSKMLPSLADLGNFVEPELSRARGV